MGQRARQALMTVQIVDILRRSENGMTRPFICRGDDDNTYFVKGKAAGRRSLIAELVCGRLAQSFGLPVAPFEIVTIDDRLISLSHLSDIADLGSGLAFGSRGVPQAQELQFNKISDLDLTLRNDILVFDWWVRNSDRCMTSKGGNPNLVWDTLKDCLVVIDHNLAFEEDFNKKSFSETHVFSDSIGTLFGDLVERDRYESRLFGLLDQLDFVLDSIPDAWWWVDEGVPALINRISIRNMLNAISEEKFWRI